MLNTSRRLYRLSTSLDKERRTWAGNTFELPAGFMDWVRSFDTDQKIDAYVDSFHIPSLSPLALDTRQRQMTADHVGLENTWNVQVDADEYVLNFREFVTYSRPSEDLSSVRNVLR